MKKSIKQITALMTTYNSSNHIRETIDSVLNQTYKDFIFLILDDCSTDNTVEIIRSYNDDRINLIVDLDNKNIGVGARLSQSLNYINTEYIVKIDSDDISHPERFAKQLNYMQQNRDIDFLKCYVNYFPDNIEIENSDRFKWMKNIKEKEVNSINTPELIKSNLFDWICFIHSLYFAKTEIIKKIGYTNTRFAEDYELFYKANSLGYTFDCIKEKLVKVRISKFSVTNHKDAGYLYAKKIYEIKKEVITNLLNNNDEIWIYGTGGLALGLYKVLEDEDIKVNGFFDKEIIQIVGLGITTKTLENTDLKNKGIIVAAQPVRAEIKSKLELYNLKVMLDYIIFA